MKKIISFILTLTLLFTVVTIPSVTITAADAVNNSSVFLKQISSSTCTLVSSAMMLRRRAYLEGNINWGSITESSLKPIAWSGGLKWDFTFAGIRVVTGSFSKMSQDQKKSKLISLLNEHPEGVVIYMYGDGKKTHAVLATDYDASSGIVYCADPANSIASGRIPLTSAYLTGKTQDERIGNLRMYWYVKSGNCTLTSPAPTPTPAPPAHTHSYSYSYDSSHPHSEYKYCSCGDKVYTTGRKNVSSCSSCNPIGNVKFSRSFEKTNGTVTFYRGSGENITSYNLTIYKEGSYYDSYNMSSTEKTLTGMPSGKYSAKLTIKNSNTGQQKSIYCDDFEFKETYNIYYNANGGSDAPDTDEKIQDTPKTLASKTPVRKGYIFKGWAKSKNATTAQYVAGATYQSNASITLYAVWEPEVYTVSFDANGGSGELESVTVTYGNKIKLPNSVILNSKYLKGWSTNKSASVPEVKPGGEFSPEQNTTFYAIWGSSTWDSEVSSSLAGSGTESDPYKIASAADLAYLANSVNSATSAPEYKYYILTDNISLNYEEWVPIGVYGNENQYFYGSFNGNGYRISNFYLTNANEGYVGIFGYAKDSIFKNVNISGIIENVGSANAVFAGSVSGYAKNTTFENCEALYVNISGISASDSETSYSGCIVGKAEGGSIKECTVSESHINLKAGDFESGIIAGYSSSEIESCNVKSTSSEGLFSTSTGVGDFKIGGICGNLSGNADKCSVNALLFSNAIKTTSTSYAGGIVGKLSGKINVCSVIFSDGDEKNIDDDKYKSSMHASGSGSYSLGGLVGFSEGSASITDCKYDGKSVSGITSSGSVSVGGFTGSAATKTNSTILVSVSGGHPLNYATLPKRDGYKATWYADATMKTPYDFSQTVTSNLTLYAKWEKGEDEIDIWNSTSKEPSYNASTKTYIITNGDELAWVSDVSNGIITNGTNFPTDITFSGYTIELANDIYLNYVNNCENWDSMPPQNAWKPIGEKKNFSGTFDGNNHTISGLYIFESSNATFDSPTIGLFSLNNGIIKNTYLKNGFVYSDGATGGFAGVNNDGIIENCHNISCTISGRSAGGIVGEDYSKMDFCSNSAKISGLGLKYSYVGGLIGESYDSIITRSYNIGEINGSANAMGGIIGKGSQTDISSCYNSGPITNNGDYAGGIFGGYETSYKDSTIFACHAQQLSVTATDYVGGIAGYVTINADITIDSCFHEGGLNANHLAGIVGNVIGDEKLSIVSCFSRFTPHFYNYNKSVYSGTVSADTVNSSYFFGDSEMYSNGKLIALGEIFKTYSVTAITDTDNSAISRSFANVDGILYSEGTTDANVGGALGSVSGNSGASDAMNFMTIASRVSSKTSGSSYMANSGYLAGNNKSGLYSFANAYYGSGMDISAVNSGEIANVYTNNEGTARSQVSLNSVFYTKTLGLNPYVSIANTESDSTAVWVLNDGQLPELYYNCLNDITVSEDIENGTVALDKEQAVNGESVTVTAIPADGYVLNKIYVNGAEIVDENNSFTVTGNSEVYVTFAEKIPEYTVNISANENAYATITNADSADVQLMAAANTLTANDGDEILVNVGTNENFSLDTILVNGEEITGDSFVLTENSTVALQVADISTEVKAVTNDAEDVGDYFAIVSGSVPGDDSETVKYIRYWKADEPENIYYTKIEEGTGEYTAEILPLEPETTYEYQMTQFGQIKSFTTLATPDDSMGSDIEEDNTDPVPTPTPLESITTTTITKLSLGYLISVNASQSLSGQKLIIGFYNSKNRLTGLKVLEGSSETTYTLATEKLSATYAKIFVVDISTLTSAASAEIVQIQN